MQFYVCLVEHTHRLTLPYLLTMQGLSEQKVSRCTQRHCPLSWQTPYIIQRAYTSIPLLADSVLFCANSSRFRPSFSDSILCIVLWYSDRVRSTESRMSLTVALKISFREDSRKIFRSLDLAMLDRAVVTLDNSPDGLYTAESILKKSGRVRLRCRVRKKQSRDSRMKVTARRSRIIFCQHVCSAPCWYGVESLDQRGPL